MSKAETLAKIQEVGLLRVIRGPSQDLTLKMVEALVQGGVTGSHRPLNLFKSPNDSDWRKQNV